MRVIKQTALVDMRTNAHTYTINNKNTLTILKCKSYYIREIIKISRFLLGGEGELDPISLCSPGSQVTLDQEVLNSRIHLSLPPGC